MMPETDLPAVLLVDKPVGPTSHDVVLAARRSLGVKRIGHTGTLDPFASGLLLLCVGRATRLVEYFHVLSKTYAATAVLGTETDTEDGTGDVTRRSDAWSGLTRSRIEAAAESLLGEYAQVPPAYSARKVAGRRSYEAARAGEQLTLEARQVEVQRFDIRDVRLPEMDFTAQVSTGTYVRSLARDLGRNLECGAHLTALRRVAIGPFHVSSALTLEDLRAGSVKESAALSAVRAVSWLPTRALSAEEETEIVHGRRIADPAGDDSVDLPVAMVVGDRLVSIGRRDSGTLRPEKVFDGR